MRPSFPRKYFANARLGDTKLPSDGGLRYGTLKHPDTYDLLFIEFRLRKLCSFGCNMPSFFKHVLSVVFSRSKEKMIWSHTVPNVAFVENPHSFRNGSVVNYPRRSVCSQVLSIKMKLPVAGLFVDAPNPRPASIRLNNFVPKEFHPQTI